MELNASPISVILGAWLPSSCADLVKAGLGQFQRLGIAIEADQLPSRAEAAGNLCRVARQAERAVRHRGACAHIEKLNRIF